MSDYRFLSADIVEPFFSSDKNRPIKHVTLYHAWLWQTLRLMKKMLRLLYLRFYRKGGDGSILRTVMRHDQLTILRTDTSLCEIVYPYMHLITTISSITTSYFYL